MAFYPTQNIFQPTPGSETYTISTSKNNITFQKTLSECLTLIQSKVPNANLLILKRNSGNSAYYIGGVVISENIFYIGDTGEYPGIISHRVYFGNGSNIGTKDIRFYTLYYNTGARLDDNPMETDTLQTMEVGEIGNCFHFVAGTGHVVYVSGGYSQLVINDGPPVQYTWTSVPSISGKNGSLSLPTLVDTDGEPISGQSASVFSSLPEGSNVRALINGAL